MQKVLIIEEKMTCEKIKRSMKNTDTYCVTEVHEALKIYVRHRFCLVIMGVVAVLSQANIIELLRMMRQIHPAPILVLGSQSDSPEFNKESILLAGANAYIDEPHRLTECLAYAHSLIQLYCDLISDAPKKQHYVLVFGLDLIIDPDQRKVILNDVDLKLTKKEFDLLFCLASHAGQVLSKEQLYNQVWEDSMFNFNFDETVKAHIKSLRKKLSLATKKEYIQNVWGVGYRFIAE